MPIEISYGYRMDRDCSGGWQVRPKVCGRTLEKLAENHADGVFAKAYRRIVPDRKLMKANEAFVTRFTKELDTGIDLETLGAKAYQEALQSFLCNPTVQGAIAEPLDSESGLNFGRV